MATKQPGEKGKVEELMKPRYKVIADYPGNPLAVGEIVTDLPDATGWKEWSERYPRLFKPLQWWEERGKYFWSDSKVKTPLFVSNIGKTFFGTAWGIDLRDGSFFLEVNGEKTSANLSNFLPATEVEYNNYLKSKQ